MGVEGEALGIVSLSEALGKAEEFETDLVEIAPKAEPPVCKIMDYGKLDLKIPRRNKLQRKNRKRFN